MPRSRPAIGLNASPATPGQQNGQHEGDDRGRPSPVGPSSAASGFARSHEMRRNRSRSDDVLLEVEGLRRRAGTR